MPGRFMKSKAGMRHPGPVPAALGEIALSQGFGDWCADYWGALCKDPRVSQGRPTTSRTDGCLVASCGRASATGEEASALPAAGGCFMPCAARAAGDALARAAAGRGSDQPGHLGVAPLDQAALFADGGGQPRHALVP